MQRASRPDRPAPKAILVAVLFVAIAGGALALMSRRKGSDIRADGHVASFRDAATFEVAEVVFDGALAAGWEDAGWGPHEVADGGPAKIQFTGYGGVIFRHAELRARFGGLTFRFRAPQSYGDFLEISLGRGQADAKLFPAVALERAYVARLDDGWGEALIPWTR